MVTSALEANFSGIGFDAFALNQSHWSLYRELYCDIETMRFVGPARSINQARADFERALWFGRERAARHQMFAIVEPAQAAAIGLCGYQHTEGEANFELGVLVLPSSQGRGLALRVLSSLESHLATHLAAEEFSLHFQHSHEAMKQVAKRLAYAIKPVQEGRFCLATKRFCTALEQAVQPN